MRLLTLQLQFSRKAGSADRRAAVSRIVNEITKCATLVQQPSHIETKEEFVNIIVQTLKPLALWDELRPKLQSFLSELIVVCHGLHGWDDYRLLHHFDSTQPADETLVGDSP